MRYKLRFYSGGIITAHFAKLADAWASMVRHGNADLLRRGIDLTYAQAQPGDGVRVLPIDWNEVRGQQASLTDAQQTRAMMSLSADHREVCRLAYGDLPMNGV